MSDDTEVYGDEDLVLSNKVEEGLKTLKEMKREELRIVNYMLGGGAVSEEEREGKVVHGVDFLEKSGLSRDKATLSAYMINVGAELRALRGIFKDKEVIEEVDTILAEVTESVGYMRLLEKCGRRESVLATCGG